jgi:hypothetical protein
MLGVTSELVPEATTEAMCMSEKRRYTTDRQRFEKTYEEVIALLCAGEGLGEFMLAHVLAEDAGGEVVDYLAL